MIKGLNKKILIIVLCVMLAALAALVMVLVNQGNNNPYGKEAASYITEDEVSKIGDVLRTAGLSNVDVFETWVYEYLENRDENFQSDAYSDADCRMTAMLLLDDQISCDGAEDYTGDYLMIDVDKMENEDGYILIRDNLKVFTTLFGETKIPSSGIEAALPENWKKYGLKVFNDSASLVSLIFTTTDGKEVFTGHAGVLVDCGSLGITEYKNYLFVEKLAFGDAFMATELNDPKELIDIFSQRDDYAVGEGEPKPLVYINDELIGALK